jgi:hypothetical protein
VKAPSYPNPRKLFTSPKAPERNTSEDKNIPSARLNLINKPTSAIGNMMKPNVAIKAPPHQVAAHRPLVAPMPINPRMACNLRPKSSPVKASPKQLNIAKKSPNKLGLRPHSSPVSKSKMNPNVGNHEALPCRNSLAVIKPNPLNIHPRPIQQNLINIRQPYQVYDKIALKPNQMIPQKPNYLILQQNILNQKYIVNQKPSQIVSQQENVRNNNVIPIRQSILKKSSPIANKKVCNSLYF